MSKLVAVSILCVAGAAVAEKAPTPPAQPAKAATAPAVVAAPPAPSAPACFELSKDGKSWSKTPEQLCVGTGDKNVEIKLTTGMPTPTEVAVFHFDLKARVRCADCNKDVFALTNPENSVFNQLQISFSGKRDLKANTETGTLTVGKTKFFYRKTK